MGHGAREHAIAKRIAEEGESVYVIMQKENIGLALESNNYLVAPYSARSTISDFIRESDIDLIFPTNEEALFQRISDLSKDMNIPCFSPSCEHSILESDKLRTKQSVSSFIQTPRSHFADRDLPNDFDFPVVLKKHGSSSKQIKIVNDRSEITSDSFPCICEEYIEGREFYLVLISDGQNCHFPYVVRDYPFLYDGNLGPKTGGMGSVSMGLELRDIQSVDIAKKFMQDYVNSLNTQYIGFLVGQFIESEKGLYFNEFDIRPGDPEAINFIDLSSDSLVDILIQGTSGSLVNLGRCRGSSISVYHVPEGYPGHSNGCKILNIAELLDSESVLISDVNFNGHTGSSRSLVTKATSTFFREAWLEVYRTSSTIDSRLHYRTDIGEELL